MLGQTNALDNGTLVNKVDSIKEDTTYIREHGSSGEMVTITTGSTLRSFIIIVNCQILDVNKTYQVPKGSLVTIHYGSNSSSTITLNIYFDSVWAGSIFKADERHPTVPGLISSTGIALGFEVTQNITIAGDFSSSYRLDITT